VAQASPSCMPMARGGWRRRHRCRHRPPQAQAQASSAFPYATGKVNGSVAQAREAAGMGRVPRETKQHVKGPTTRERRRRRRFMLGGSGEERASCCGTLRRQRRSEVRCGEDQCLERIGTSGREDTIGREILLLLF
jgi:hypothetical protein